MKRFIQPILWLISAIVLGIILLPVGFLYDLGKCVKEAKTISFFKRFWSLIKAVFLNLSWLCGQTAIAIDLLGNVISGELLEDCLTSEENTTFRDPNITISASVGKLEIEGKLNKTGIWFSKLLSKVFEDNHCINAYNSYKAENQIQ